jgi:type IV pilus assembly protein PilA
MAGVETESREEEYMVRGKKGFTLIELLIVLVIIGILCAITIPKFANSKQNTYVTAMKSDLRNLATYQESYAADSLGQYFSGDGIAQGFRPSQSVQVSATAVNGPPASWSADATHTRTTRTCNISTSGIASCT